MEFLNVLLQHPVVSIFFTLNLVLGVWLWRQSKDNNFEEYALAGRSLPLGVVVMTLLGTLVARGDLWQSDYAFRYGVVDVVTLLAWVAIFLFIGTFIAPLLAPFRGSTTLGDLMGTFYGDVVHLVAGVMSIGICVLMIGSQVRAIKTIFTLMYDSAPLWGMLLLGLVVTGYTVLGGVRLISYMDVLKMTFLLISLVWVMHLISEKTGGVLAVWDALPEDKKLLLKHPLILFKMKLSFFWAIFPTFIFTPPIVQRMLMVESKSRMRYTWYFVALFSALILGLMMWIGISAFVVKDAFGLQEKSKNVFLVVIKKLFDKDSWKMDYMVVALLSVLVATIDSFLHALGIVVVQDVVRPVMRMYKANPLVDNQKIVLSKFSIVVCGGASFALGIFGKELLLYTNVVLVSGFLLPPFLISLCGLKSDIESLIAYCVSYGGGLMLFRWLEWDRYEYFFVALAIGLFVYVLMHLSLHRGFVMVGREGATVHESIWSPSWHRMRDLAMDCIEVVLRLPELARKEVERRPVQAMGFSMLIFFTYALRSILGKSVWGGSVPGMMISAEIVGILLCCGLMSKGIWPVKWKPYLPLYWLVSLWYCLPLSGTIFFLRMHEGMAAAFCFVGSFALLSLLVSTRFFFWLGLTGFLGAYGWHWMMVGWPIDLDSTTYVAAHVILEAWGFTVLCFGRGVEHHLAEKVYMNKAFSHAMNHDAKQSLAQVAVISLLYKRLVKGLTPMKNKKGESGFWLPKSKQGKIEEGSQRIGDAVQRIGDEFARFNVLLDKDIAATEKELLGMGELIASIVPLFPKKYTDKVTVEVEVVQDFAAFVIRPLFVNVMLNFLKNACLHGGASRMVIRVDGRQRQIFIWDNGKGIPSKVLPHIFDLRFTTRESRKGVGLSLIKVILHATGIKVSCRSRHGDKGSFTQFAITFPEYP